MDKNIIRKVCNNIHIEALLLFFSSLAGLDVLLLAVGGYSNEVFYGYLSITKLTFLNVVPVVLFIELLYGLIGRVWIAFALGGSISFAISLCNYYKLVFRDDPLYFEDVTLIKEALKMSGTYSPFIDGKILLSAAGIFLLALLLYVIARRKAAGWRRRWVITVLMIIIAWLVYPVYKDNQLYNSFENYEVLNRWGATQEYVSHGFFYPFIHSMAQYKETAPDGYDKAVVEELFAEYSDKDIPSDRKVNIIAVMREAYVDFSQYDIAGFDNSSYDPYHQLQAESYTGDLIVNIFGGGTIDTERDFLTGDYVLRNFRGNTNSYVWYFRSQGYTVEGSHPFFQWFYNRRNVNQYLGFSRYRYYEDTFAAMTERYYPEDELMYMQLYQDFNDNKISGNPYFSFSVNVQSHGPYATTNRKGEREFLTGDQYSVECKTAVDNYMAMIVDSDERLIDFLHVLETEEEPVVFVLFSDHLPWMGDGNVYYTEMGIDFSQPSEEMERLQYTTEYLLWANDAAKEVLGNDFVGDGPTISPCYLMNLLFEQCSWEGPAYMQIMDEMREIFPVVSTLGRYIVDDSFIYEMPEERRDLFNRFLCVQYYWRNEFIYK